uniref:Uncharacterized protein n=1 Tax=viral metagenome TaxID=1070528 RepID=A0A6C0JVP0_9ZZZZ
MNIVTCPHCEMLVEIEEINCGIFRHGVFKGTNQQLEPHLLKEQCDALINNNQIYGCGKPFSVIIKDGILYAQSCDYV